MKKNGFISITIVYTFFFVFLMVLLYTISNYTDNRTMLNVVRNDIKDELNEKIDKYYLNCNDQTLACVIAKTYNPSSANLIYHDRSLTGGALDLSYRYAGSNPDNYLCFGSSAGSCPSGNLYRIIGLMDENRDGFYQVKIIKNTALTSTELGIGSGSSFPWSNNNSNEWANSNIYTLLNDSTTGFLKAYDANWQNLIDNNYAWQIGGINALNQVPSNILLNELNNTSVIRNKVGLMYISDYVYANSNTNWNKNVNSYNSSNNWLFKSNDYFITKNSSTSNSVYFLNTSGAIASTNVISSYSLRPVLYLKTNVLFQTGNGSLSSPYRIGV